MEYRLAAPVPEVGFSPEVVLYYIVQQYMFSEHMLGPPFGTIPGGVSRCIRVGPAKMALKGRPLGQRRVKWRPLVNSGSGLAGADHHMTTHHMHVMCC